MERFIAGFNWNYPNASLSLADTDENEDTVILAITSPRYDNQTGMLTYTARILENPVDDRLSYHVSRADAGIPERFGPAELTLGGCGDGDWTCGTYCDEKTCHDCGKIDKIGCCFKGIRLCRPCKGDCQYKSTCREKYGGMCGDVKIADGCGPG